MNSEEKKNNQEAKPEVKKDKKKKVDHEKEKLKKENIELTEKILRISAEMQNMRRRYDEEISKIYKYEGEDLIKNLLPIIDNFERAVKSDDNNLEDEVSRFLEGFKMIYASFLSLLKDKGIQEIECLGKSFDPKYMEAVLTDSDKTQEHNIVLDVLQKGYVYNDKVIRPAMVKVNE